MVALSTLYFADAQNQFADFLAAHRDCKESHG
jgi:hypothetical protein